MFGYTSHDISPCSVRFCRPKIMPRCGGKPKGPGPSEARQQPAADWRCPGSKSMGRDMRPCGESKGWPCVCRSEQTKGLKSLKGLKIHWKSRNPTFEKWKKTCGILIYPDEWYIYIYHISWDISWYIKLVGGLEHEFYCSIDWEFNHPNWRFVIFFRGVGQPPTSFMIFISAFLLVNNCHCWWLQCVHTYFQLLLTNGNSRILNWRYCTIFLAICCGDIPANIGLKKNRPCFIFFLC